MDSLSDSLSSPDYLRAQIKHPSPNKLVAPKNIIQTVEGAKTIYFQYRNEHLKRIDLYAQIEGLIAGNPPYSPSELAKNRLQHIANFNSLDGRSLYERGALAYWNLLNETEYIAEFILRDPQNMAMNAPELVEYAQIMAIHFNDAVRSWPSFSTIMNTLAGQLVKLGISPVIWPDERDWRFRTIELSRFFVEDQAQADIEKVTSICVESIFTVQFLFEVYEEFKDKTKECIGKDGKWDYDKCPWNIQELVKLLMFKANSFSKSDYQFFDMMDVQRRIQNGDLSFNAIFSDSLRIVSLLYQEYDGKITHYMFDRTYDSGEFLYMASKQYTCMQEAIVIFTASPGEFTIHSNRGLGHKIFSGVQAMMQLDCSIMDMSRMASTPILKSLSTGSKDLETVRFYSGVPTIIGNAEFVQNNLGANIQQLIGASQYMLGKLQYNTANSGDDPGVPDRNVGSISDSQARRQTYKEFGVLKNNIAHFYSQMDIVYRNVFIKMLYSKETYPGYECAKEFKQKCLDDGVPEEFFSTKDEKYFGLPSFMRIKASRVAGDGSTLARIMGLQELGVIAGDFGPKAAKQYQRQWVMATMGPQYVAAFVTPEEPDEMAGGASLAGVENNSMTQGMSPIFSPDNEHRSHIVTHLALGNHVIQKLQQQQTTAVEADKIFSVLIPHMQQHIQAISKSIFARKFLDGIKKPWGQLAQYATLNRKNAGQEIQAQIKKQQELEAENKKVLTEEELRDLQVKNDEGRKDFKVQQQAVRAKEASDTRADVMKEKVQKDADNQRLKITLEAGNKSQEAQKAALEAEPLPELRKDLARINGVTPSPYDILGE